MDAELRTKNIEDIVNRNKRVGTMPIWYENERQIKDVYKINLDFLVYNPYNGRISSYVKTYEKEKGVQLDSSLPEHLKVIEDFLAKSNKSRNEKTEISIRNQGQMKYGIVTKDGFIIDGNRRASIINKICRKDGTAPGYFLAVILDEKLNDNAAEIRKLETTYQLGEDDKVDYNPIEKYLKCKDLISDFSAKDIATMMNEKESDIIENLEIMSLMDQYLDNLGYGGYYTRLYNTEDLFINLNKVLKKWGKSQGKLKWKADKSDLSDYQLICFDLIRYTYNSPKGKGIDPKTIREKLLRNGEETFVANEQIWRDFSDRHEKNVEPLSIHEKSIDDYRRDNPTTDLSQLLKSRDEAWSNNVDSKIKENFGMAISSLDNLINKNEPLKLLRAALSKIETVESVSDTKPFLEDDKVYEIVDLIRKKSDSLKSYIKKFRKHN